MNKENINKNKEYSKPYMKIVHLDMQDVILTSPHPCVGDGDPCDHDLSDPF